MEEQSQIVTIVPEKEINNLSNLRRCSNELNYTLTSSISNLKGSANDLSSSSDNEDTSRRRIMKRIKRFSDSDSDEENSLNEGTSGSSEKIKLAKSTLIDSDSDFRRYKKVSYSSRMKTKRSLSNSDSSGREASHSDKYKLKDSDSDENVSIKAPLKSSIHKNGKVSDSEETENEKTETHITRLQNTDSENDTVMFRSKPHKSNIQSNSNLSDSSKSGSDNAVKNEEQQLRSKNKRNKLQDKFKNLITIRGKESPPANVEDELNGNSDTSHTSGDDMASIEKIKQKIKERMSFKPSICDPDTSDEESGQPKPVYKKKKERKMTKLISPPAQRMSAKQAMENMQKIKSESNRMLREKEVSLPYHRPKALSLKDIMNRRKLAVSADGKALPIKMNEDQLKHYARMLDERQKEMMELCKSESEEDNEEIENKSNDNGDEVDKDAVTKELIESNDDNLTSINNDNNINETNNYMNENHVERDEKSDNAVVNVNIDNSTNLLSKEQDSDSSMRLVYNDSANSNADDMLTTDLEESRNPIVVTERLKVNSNINIEDKAISEESVHENIKNVANEANTLKPETELDSQLISLHFDTENIINTVDEELTEDINKNATVDKSSDLPYIAAKPVENNFETSETTHLESNVSNQGEEDNVANEIMDLDNEFSDDEINMADIDNIIENAEIIKVIEDKVNSQFLVRDKPLNLNPKLTGAPGMVIDFDTATAAPRKSGVELLKERFTYFAKLKTPDEIERERETKVKPGTQLKKLKLELEEKMTEQRSLEWAKRLEDEKQQHNELKVLRGEESDGDDIDKIEAAIEANEVDKEENNNSGKSDSETEEEPIENDVEIRDKPRIKNTMLDDEAEESDCDEDENDANDVEQNDENEDGDEINGDNDDDENESESDESSESEEEQTTTKKGRILKAFEDSDEEDTLKLNEPCYLVEKIQDAKGTVEAESNSVVDLIESQNVSQDEELQLAQRHKAHSEDLFTSQESTLLASEPQEKTKDISESEETFTQTFSILESSKVTPAELDLNCSGKLSAVCSIQSLEASNLDDVSDMCPVTDSQCQLPLPSQIPTTLQSQSQSIGADILALCTGKFYDNQFVSQPEDVAVPLSECQKYDAFDNYKSQYSQEDEPCSSSLAVSHVIKGSGKVNDPIEPIEETDFIELNTDKENKTHKVDEKLKSILDELADPEFDTPKPKKYFPDSFNTDKVTQTGNHVKKKFVIDSDDETNEITVTENKKCKQIKKRKPEKRALQISDDEDEISEQDDVEEYETDIEEETPERLVEYDSEENEIELIKPKNVKKKRKMTEFFENEAELTSEDEWVGSGDEDEAGLDRMEREEGDDETFHQGKLQRELGQIHMRDVMDQDKREVRLIQELLFEDGDLGEGGRQRKFRWQNIDGVEETGTIPDEFADTQEEEFESEEQWRKQRHEREMFLRQMQNKDEPEESPNVTVNRTSIIKANLLSKTMSSLLMEVNSSTEKAEIPVVEKNTAKDVPSPKKPFALLQHSYQGSLLSRGRGALARLAALATPLAADDDAKVATLGPTSRRNFVFATLTPDEKAPKITKRKAESNLNTPKLVKKMRTEDKINTSKSSLLDHFKL